MFHLFLISIFITIIDCDPFHTGGKLCETIENCGGINNGMCLPKAKSSSNKSYCVCYEKFGNPDCSYTRKSKNLAGGLQFLALAGIGGIGNFILERTNIAIVQSILMGSVYIALICAYCIGLTFSQNYMAECPALIYLIMIICAYLPIILIWCIVDGIQILSGSVLDGWGYATY